jgi:hypothetical protein
LVLRLRRENWISYKVINEKYVIEADFRYFRKARIDDNSTSGKDIVEHYKTTNDQYEKAKYSYLNNEKDYKSYLRYSTIGGVPEYGNWSTCTEFPLDIIHDESNNQLAYPITEDKRRFQYIGVSPK